MRTYLPAITLLCEERQKAMSEEMEYDIKNNTDKEMEWILAQKHILTAQNDWRQRLTYVYEDPDNKEMTYSVGYFNKPSNVVCIAHEKLSSWRYEMNRMNADKFVITK